MTSAGQVKQVRAGTTASPERFSLTYSRMTTRRKAEECRICGNELQGNQRRWLFAAHKRAGAQNLSPTRSLSRETASTLSPSRSSQSSPWGSTLSLGSSHSHYRSQTLPSMNKGMDLLAVLKHVLGQPILRENGRGEFICGKCVSVLERVFKFDTVIARVRMLSKERLQKLTQERDGISRWMQAVYRQRHPSELRNPGSSSEDEVDVGERKVYQEMLNDNMALAAYEFWSEKPKQCPYFSRTGKKCNKSKNCECCDALRVSDSDYESVCGIPRHLPEHAVTPLGLSRDKSQSMPLDWSKAPSFHSSPALFSGSCHSLHGQMRKASTHSMDSLDGQDPFDSSEENPVIWSSILKKLKYIEGKPVQSPVGSRIPVLAKGQNGGLSNGSSSSPLVQVLNFIEGDEDEDELNGESEDVLTELGDEFLPLHREVTTANCVVRQLQEQLDQAHTRIRTLEMELQNSIHTESSDASVSRPSPSLLLNGTLDGESLVIHNLGHSLRSREKVIQESVGLIRSLCVELGVGLEETDKLISKLTVSLTDTRSEREGVLEAELVELREREMALQNELEAMQESSRGRERDLLTLNTVLQSNQDVINDLRIDLAEKTKCLQDMQKERSLWKERDVALDAMLYEKDVLISRLEEALESAHKDVQVLSDSLNNQGRTAGGAEAALASQVQENVSLLSSCLKDWEMQTATVKKEVNKLYTASEDTEAVIQNQKQTHKQAIKELSAQLKVTREELRETIKNAKQSEQTWKTERAKTHLEERRLRECLLKRDKLIEQVLLDAEKRDSMLIELHQSFPSKVEPKISPLQHTL